MTKLNHARPIVAFLLAIAIGWESGPFIRSGGFGSLMLWLICACVCPAIVCLVTDRWYYFLAPLTALIMCASVEYHSYVWYQAHSADDAWKNFKLNLDIIIGMAVFCLGISLMVALAFHMLRKSKRSL